MYGRPHKRLPQTTMSLAVVCTRLIDHLCIIGTLCGAGTQRRRLRIRAVTRVGDRKGKGGKCDKMGQDKRSRRWQGVLRTKETPSNLTGRVSTGPDGLSPCPTPSYDYNGAVSAIACRAFGLSPELDCLGYVSPYQNKAGLSSLRYDRFYTRKCDGGGEVESTCLPL